MISSVTTRPSDPRSNAPLFDNSESRCAVLSSPLIDGVHGLHLSSRISVAANFSISVTEPHHRQSHAIRPHHRACRRRQDTCVPSSSICTRSLPLSRSSNVQRVSAHRPRPPRAPLAKAATPAPDADAKGVRLRADFIRRRLTSPSCSIVFLL
jgi:hypothetical protein